MIYETRKLYMEVQAKDKPNPDIKTELPPKVYYS